MGLIQPMAHQLCWLAIQPTQPIETGPMVLSYKPIIYIYIFFFSESELYNYIYKPFMMLFFFTAAQFLGLLLLPFSSFFSSIRIRVKGMVFVFLYDNPNLFLVWISLTFLKNFSYMSMGLNLFSGIVVFVHTLR